MNFRIISFLLIIPFLLSCDQSSNKPKFNFESRYKNTGFALIYNPLLEDIKEIEPRSLDIYHKSLKKKSMVKITNPENNKYLIAQVKSNRVKFSSFYNC